MDKRGYTYKITYTEYIPSMKMRVKKEIRTTDDAVKTHLARLLKVKGIEDVGVSAI